MDVPGPYVFVVLALAVYRTTVLAVKDWVPFGGLREAIWRRWPAGDGDRVPPSHIGYLLTCQSCMGVWHAAVWWAAWQFWPAVTLAVGVLFAVAAVQRSVAVVADAVESVNEDA